jgi:hypothetical protein
MMNHKPELPRTLTGRLAVPKGSAVLYSSQADEEFGRVVGHVIGPSGRVSHYQVVTNGKMVRVPTYRVLREARDRQPLPGVPEHIPSLVEFARLCRMIRATVLRNEDTLLATVAGRTAICHVCSSEQVAVRALKTVQASLRRVAARDPRPRVSRAPYPSYRWATGGGL